MIILKSLAAGMCFGSCVVFQIAINQTIYSSQENTKRSPGECWLSEKIRKTEINQLYCCLVKLS